MSDDTTKKASPAYSTYKTTMSFVDGLADAMPTVVDRSIMSKMSGSGQAAILSSLRFLKLINSKNQPTPLLKKLAGSQGDERKAVLNEMLNGSYDLIDTLDLSTATSKQVNEWFRDQGVHGSTVARAFTFFVTAADEAGITLSKYLRDNKPKASSNGGGAGTRKAATKRKPRKKPDASTVPKGSTKFDLPVPGATSIATLILPNDITAEDWALLNPIFTMYAERHIAAAASSEGDSD